MSGAAAPVVLAHTPHPSMAELGKRVGPSPPAAARMVDSLEEAELLTRNPGGGRSVAITPAPAGERAVDEVLAPRTAGLVEPLADGRERRAFGARTEFVAIAVVLSSLHRVVPIILGITALGERMQRHQTSSLAGALVAVEDSPSMRSGSTR